MKGQLVVNWGKHLFGGNRTPTPHRILLSLFVLFAGCAPSARAIRALRSGDYCEFCRISASAAATEPSSMHNLGLCYENGWCGYAQNRDLAVQQYTMGARWGIVESSNALIKLGYTPPAADLKMAQDLAEARETAAMWSAIGAALLSSASGMNQQPTYNAPSYNTLQQQSSLGMAPIVDHQGCCSWHGGIRRDILGNHQCHFSGMVLCSDFEPSPTCRC
jgi:hypothetical protein